MYHSYAEGDAPRRKTVHSKLQQSSLFGVMLMAQMIGELRADKATHGEKLVYKLLRENLPADFKVYVEIPIPGERQLRFPDFVVVTNYGFIVLEVKDWVHIVEADAYHAYLVAGGKTHRKRNPVLIAREYALMVVNRLQNKLGAKTPDIPWGYAVVLPHLPSSTITQLRESWGEQQVFGKEDLRPDLCTNRLKNTIPLKHIRSLTRKELDIVRETLNPVVVIPAQQEGGSRIVLDEAQELIATEPVRAAVPQVKPKPSAEQMALIEQEPQDEETIEDYGRRLSRNTSIRLVRGIAGSGKTLVLTQRARYLAGLYPEWQILVVTYNRQLSDDLKNRLRRLENIQVCDFHQLCRKMLGNYPTEPQTPLGWLNHHKEDYPIIQQLGTDYLVEEFKWMYDCGILTRDEYLDVARKGRKRGLDFTLREQVFDLFEAYQQFHRENKSWDWGEVPLRVLQGIEQGKIEPPVFQAILIDEAQDFAPKWFDVLQACLDPHGGLFFMADDPSQSIYRYHSWKEKGVPVVGRTRWLRVPYRNTYEIYRAAYKLIEADESVQTSLEQEGVVVTPELDPDAMRHGELPLLRRFDDLKQEVEYIRGQINDLLQKGVSEHQIAVLCRRKANLSYLNKGLRGLGVNVNTYHAYKGREFDTVFLTQLNDTFQDQKSPEELSRERRLVYMAMTRARERLFMGYSYTLPEEYGALDGAVDHIRI